MRFIIRKNRHRAGFNAWLKTTGIFRKDRIIRKVIFQPSCKYVLPSIEDQQDVNKLFGFSICSFWRLVWIWISWPVFALLNVRRHHVNSARVGWFFDPDISKIVLMAYCYVDRSRTIEKICEVKIFDEYEIVIFNKPGEYHFNVKNRYWDTIGDVIIKHRHSMKFGYMLGPYFGGNNPAPHDIHFNMKKL